MYDEYFHTLRSNFKAAGKDNIFDDAYKTLNKEKQNEDGIFANCDTDKLNEDIEKLDKDISYKDFAKMLGDENNESYNAFAIMVDADADGTITKDEIGIILQKEGFWKDDKISTKMLEGFANCASSENFYGEPDDYYKYTNIGVGEVVEYRKTHYDGSIEEGKETLYNFTDSTTKEYTVIYPDGSVKNATSTYERHSKINPDVTETYTVTDSDGNVESGIRTYKDGKTVSDNFTYRAGDGIKREGIRTYDDNGNAVLTDFENGSYEKNKYDGDGNLISTEYKTVKIDGSVEEGTKYYNEADNPVTPENVSGENPNRITEKGEEIIETGETEKIPEVFPENPEVFDKEKKETDITEKEGAYVDEKGNPFRQVMIRGDRTTVIGFENGRAKTQTVIKAYQDGGASVSKTKIGSKNDTTRKNLTKTEYKTAKERNLFNYTNLTNEQIRYCSKLGDDKWQSVQKYLKDNPNATFDEMKKALKFSDTYESGFRPADVR